MPELPEVETIRRDLLQHIKGERIESAKLITNKTVRNQAVFFVNYLKNRKIEDISRRGKLLIFELEYKRGEKENKFMFIHLKMTGQLIFVKGDKSLAGGHSLSDKSFEKAVGGSLPNKHTRVIFYFSNNSILFFNDLRRFGYVEIIDKEKLDKILLENYGPEPLTLDLTVDYLQSILKNRTANIKAILLNQKLIAGLGNIYVDEALFLAKIKPQRLGKSIRKDEIKRLCKSIDDVIEKAIYNRGTTFNNYVDSQGKKGNFVNFLKVYGRGKQTCYQCGRLIRKVKLAGRGTHYCPNCQK